MPPQPAAASPQGDAAGARRDSSNPTRAAAPVPTSARGPGEVRTSTSPQQAPSSSANRQLAAGPKEKDGPVQSSKKKTSSGFPLILVFGLLGGGLFLFLLLTGGGVAAYFLLRSKPDETSVASSSGESRSNSTSPKVDLWPAPKKEEPAATPANNKPDEVLPKTPEDPQEDTEKPTLISDALIQPTPQPQQPPKQPQQPPASPDPGPGSLSRDVLDRVKKATVYIRVTGADKSQSSGSGFFEDSSHKVLTNAHVIGMLKPGSPKPQKIEIVRNSGMPNVVTYEAKILGVDQDSDLAVLEAIMKPGEEASVTTLKVAMAKDLIETQRVFVFGYPLGEELNTRVTVAESSVSSLHTSEDGLLKQVQVNGGMHPGNSGGPVVDSRGNVVGVAVAIIRGTQINFAIPGEYVTAVLNGRLSGNSNGTEVAARSGKFYANVKFQTIDPLARIKKVEIDYWIGDAKPKGFGPSAQQPVLGPDAGPRRTLAATYKEQQAAVDIELEAMPPPGKVVWYQGVVTNGGGERAWSAATAFSPLPPVDPKPATLAYHPKVGTVPVKLSSTARYQISAAGESIPLQVNQDAQLSESTVADGTGTRAAVSVKEFATSISKDGKPSESPEAYKTAVTKDIHGLLIDLVADNTGRLTSKRSNLAAVPAPSRAVLETVADQIQALLDGASVPLTNTGELQPGQSWQIQRLMPFDVPVSPQNMAMMNVTYTYRGRRLYEGRNVAVFSLQGTFIPQPGSSNVTGQMTGNAMLDLETGVVLRATANTDATAMVTVRSRTSRLGVVYQVKAVIDTSLTRSSDVAPNPPSTTPPTTTPTNPTRPDPVIAQQKNGETQIMGLSANPQFKETAPDGGVLVGLEIGLDKFGPNDCIRAFRGIYLNDKKEEVKGKQYGTNLTRVVTVKAKPGYAVAGIVAKAGLTMDGMLVIFMRVGLDGKLDPSDSYRSEWVGGKGGGAETQLGGDGTPVIGLIGKANAKDATGLGLLLKQP